MSRSVNRVAEKGALGAVTAHGGRGRSKHLPCPGPEGEGAGYRNPEAGRGGLANSGSQAAKGRALRAWAASLSLERGLCAARPGTPLSGAPSQARLTGSGPPRGLCLRVWRPDTRRVSLRPRGKTRPEGRGAARGRKRGVRAEPLLPPATPCPARAPAGPARSLLHGDAVCAAQPRAAQPRAALPSPNGGRLWECLFPYFSVFIVHSPY